MFYEQKKRPILQCGSIKFQKKNLWHSICENTNHFLPMFDFAYAKYMDKQEIDVLKFKETRFRGDQLSDILLPNYFGIKPTTPQP